MTKKAFTIIACLLFASLPYAESHAGIIDGFLGWSSGVASVAFDGISNPDPNNDNVVGPSDNRVRITQKDYTGVGPVDVMFSVRDSDGVTEYVLEEGVFNNTGMDWDCYTLQLGFGEGSDFVLSDPGDGLDFDAPDFDSPQSIPPFTTVTVTEDEINATGGLLVDFMFSAPLLISIDVPDGIDSFTIRQLPKVNSIPEPASALLLSLSGFGWAVMRRRS